MIKLMMKYKKNKLLLTFLYEERARTKKMIRMKK
jgi:hypothetical protein